MDSPSKNMRFDVCSVEKGKNVLHNIPELKNLKSFENYPGSKGEFGLNQDKVIKYIVILYSEDSFLNKKPVTALGERKLQAADAAGFPRNSKNEFEENVLEALFNIKSFEVLQMIMEFLMYQKKHLWTEIITTEQEYEEYIRKRTEPVTEAGDKDSLMAVEKKDKLRASCKAMRKDLTAMYHEFFTDNSDVEALHDVKDRATLEKRARPS